MNKITNLNKGVTRISIFSWLLLFIHSCSTSMSPTQVNNTLPSLTASQFIAQTEVEGAIESEKCKYVVKGREYTAPMGLTLRMDLKNAAKGIDEWIALDGANSYVLKSYKWATVDHKGSTQLQVVFDTLLCE